MAKKTDNLDFLNWDAPQDQIEILPPPYIQWFNGQGKAFAKLNPVLASGGWELPYDVWGTYLGDQHEIVEVPHGKGTVVDAYLFPCLHVATINTRFIWQLYENGQTVYSKDYVKGATGRLNVYALVKELGNFPVMLTLKGMVGKAFSNVRKQHLNTVIKAASMVGKAKGYPQYMFWMPVIAGDSVMVGKEGQQSAITPPVAAWNIEGLNDKGQIAKILVDLYIGDELRNLVNDELYEQSITWKEQYEKADEDAQDNGGNEGPAIDPNEFNRLMDEYEDHDPDELPFPIDGEEARMMAGR